MILIGRLTKDAVVAQLKDDRKVVNFTVAINDYYKPKGSDKGISVTTFISCVYWLNAAIADRLTRGSLVEDHRQAFSERIYEYGRGGEGITKLPCRCNQDSPTEKSRRDKND